MCLNGNINHNNANHFWDRRYNRIQKDIINNNLNAIKSSIDNLNVLETVTLLEEGPKLKKNIFEKINSRMGNDLKVSDLIPYRAGEFPTGLTKDIPLALHTLLSSTPYAGAI